jgi:hypothetical protein
VRPQLSPRKEPSCAYTVEPLRHLRVVLPIVSVFALLAGASAALVNEDGTVFVMDRCEPDSFDAVLGAGGCVRDGGVTFEDFLRRGLATQWDPTRGNATGVSIDSIMA